MSSRARQLIHVLIWFAGLAGFLGPMVYARTHPHADLVRTAALIWFFIFGLLNAVFVLRAFPARRRLRGAKNSPVKP